MELPDAYMYFVRHIVPGPQSISWLVPHFLLPIALLVPRSILSRRQSISLVMPIILGCTIHAWIIMESVDVPSLNTLFWSAFLLVFNDPWNDFAMLKANGETKDMSTQIRVGQDDQNIQSQGFQQRLTKPKVHAWLDTTRTNRSAYHPLL